MGNEGLRTVRLPFDMMPPGHLNGQFARWEGRWPESRLLT